MNFGIGFINAYILIEYFVHVSGLIDKTNENDEVTFELEDEKKGLNAVNMKLA
jgi:CspA family cold shock protein